MYHAGVQPKTEYRTAVTEKLAITKTKLELYWKVWWGENFHDMMGKVLILLKIA